jgi:LCP family protein required for cell wall assembly
MVLRFDPNTGQSALLSLPRDLWVTISSSGHKDRINSAYSVGPDVLVKTIEDDFGIPINHYVEVGFEGFKRLVDAVGGVSMWFDDTVRDTNTGLYVKGPACAKLGGVQALEFARSRHLQYFSGGRWRDDPSADLGRISRQQFFVKRALSKALSKASNPLVLNQLINAAVQSLKVDSGVNLGSLADRLRALGGANLATYTFPATGVTIDGKAVLLPDMAAGQPLLDLFSGTASTATTASTASASTASTASAAATNPATSASPPTTTKAVGVLPTTTPTCN